MAKSRDWSIKKRSIKAHFTRSGGFSVARKPVTPRRAVGPDDGNPLQYTGREVDGTGLYYYRARYYDPVLKRFISDDPSSGAKKHTVRLLPRWII